MLYENSQHGDMNSWGKLWLQLNFNKTTVFVQVYMHRSGIRLLSEVNLTEVTHCAWLKTHDSEWRDGLEMLYAATS